MIVVVLPDYSGNQHEVVGPFESPEAGRAWAREHVGAQRAWFTAPTTDPSKWTARR